MKKLIPAVCLFSVFVISCNQNAPSRNASEEAEITFNECYRSVVGKDSATLNIQNLNGKVKGTLFLNFAKKDDMKGEIAGTFRGDTLFADFTYKLGSKKETFKNPAAFLKKEGKLYQGYGELLTQYGRTYFNKDVPIDFDRGFEFEVVDCK